MLEKYKNTAHHEHYANVADNRKKIWMEVLFFLSNKQFNQSTYSYWIAEK